MCNFLNIYAPYADRDCFFDVVGSKGLLNFPYLLIASDLNFNLSSTDIWGDYARSDPLASYFTQLFTDSQLVDILPHNLGPTLRNGCTRGAGIRKCLDCFLVAKQSVHN